MFNTQHFTFDISILLVAIALIVHTIAEAWIPVYQKVQPDWKSVVFGALFLDNLPVFIFSIGVAVAGWTKLENSKRVICLYQHWWKSP